MEGYEHIDVLDGCPKPKEPKFISALRESCIPNRVINTRYRWLNALTRKDRETFLLELLTAYYLENKSEYQICIHEWYETACVIESQVLG